MINIKNVLIGVGVFLLGTGITLAAVQYNYIKSGENWDANVGSGSTANDVFTLSGRLDIVDSFHANYDTGFRGTIKGDITTDLFGHFKIDNDTDPSMDADDLLLLSESTKSIPSECQQTAEKAFSVFDISGSIYSPFWGVMDIDSNSYFCDNEYIHLVLHSEHLGFKDIGDHNQTGLVDNFGKQEISISGIARVEGTTGTGILSRGDQDINRLNVEVSTKAVLKRDLNKNIHTVLTTNTSETSTTLLTADFNNVSNTDKYYLYDYTGDIESGDVQYNGVDYINKGKILTIGNTALNPPQKIEVTGKNTVIVEEGNILIRSNIYNNDDNDSILILMAKRGDNGNGGNIYIDPKVTNIDAVLIADGSLMSMKNKIILESEDSSHQQELRNQLLIYGSILSSNSIGTDIIPYGADYYDKGTYSANDMPNSIYDFGNLRTFNVNYGEVGFNCENGNKVAPIDGAGNYKLNAWAGRKGCYNDDIDNSLESKSVKDADLRGSTKSNPVIVEYNPNITKISPYIFTEH